MVLIIGNINHKFFLNKRLFTTINEMDILLYILILSIYLRSGFIVIIEVESLN